MPRNSTGNYTLPAGNPVLPDTIIETNWANPTMNDIGAALTDSLDRQGRGTMLDQLKLIDGTAVKPSIAFNSNGNTGMYLIPSNTIGFAVGGVLGLSIAATGVTIAAGLNVGGAVTFSGTLGIPLGTPALPGLFFTGDPDTGIFSPGPNQIGFTAGGFTRMYLDTTGGWVVGSASGPVPTIIVQASSNNGRGLELRGAGVAGDLVTFEMTDGAATARFAIRATNTAVGIGTDAALPLNLYTSGATRVTISPAGAVTMTGDLVAANFYVGTTTAAAGTLGLPSGVGSSVVAWGNAAPGAGRLDLMTGGVPSVIVEASGDVGIGGISPVHFASFTTLEVRGKSAGAGGIFRTSSSDNVVQGDFNCFSAGASSAVYFGSTTAHPLVVLTGGNERMRITAAGDVGVGFVPNGSGKFSVASANWAIPTGAGQIYALSNNPAAIDLGGQIVMGGSYTGNSDTTFAAISGRKENASADIAGYLSLSTNQNGFGMVERLRINSAGQVGIRTNAPVATLTVGDNTQTGNTIQLRGSAAALTIVATDNGGGGSFGLANNNSAGSFVGVTTNTAGIFSNVLPLVFTTQNAERMRIDNNGNVGLGILPQSASVKLAILSHVTIQAATAAGVSLYTYDSAGTIVASQGYNGSAAAGFEFSGRLAGMPLIFTTVGFERMRISAAGVITQKDALVVASDPGTTIAVPVGGFVMAGVTGAVNALATINAAVQNLTVFATGAGANLIVNVGTFRNCGALNSSTNNALWIRTA